MHAAPLGSFDLREAISGTIDLFSFAARNRRTVVDWSVSPDLPQIVQADRAVLQQVLSNLLGNAIKFAPNGRVTVRVKCGAGADGALAALVEIADDGPGLPGPVHAALGASPPGDLPGPGLGLPLARHLLHLVGGQLGTKEAVKGCHVWFTYPLVEARPSTASACATPVGLRASEPEAEVPQVLVVDDDRSIRTALRYALERDGFRVEEAANGVQALERLKSRTPDLVLMDAVMPQLDGFGACAEISKLRPGTPVLMITALEDETAVERAFAAGAKDYIAKPVNFKTLSQRVGRIIKASGAERALMHSEEMLRRLSTHLQSVREEERQHVAREIHDVLGASLTVIKMELALLLRRLPAESTALREKTQELVALSDGAISTVRRICSELRPSILDNFGVLAAIEWLAQEYSERFGISCALLNDTDEPDLAPEAATALFRIVQEALTNITRHANASRIQIHTWQSDGMLTIEVADNGCGITEEQIGNTNSLGLLGMFERARLFGGKVEVTGEPGRGTRIHARFPLAEQAVQGKTNSETTVC